MGTFLRRHDGNKSSLTLMDTDGCLYSKSFNFTNFTAADLTDKGSENRLVSINPLNGNENRINYEVVTARATTQTLHKVEQNEGNHVEVVRKQQEV